MENETEPQYSLRPITSISHGSSVLQALSAYITEAGLKRGDRLPSERSLAEQLGVSRSTVREALQSWQAMGLVSMRKGSGTYLDQEVNGAALHVPVTITLEKKAVLDSLELRRSIESDAARLAARRAGKADLERLKATLEEMEAVYRRHGFALRQDKKFHEALYMASGNPLYLQISQQIITRIAEAFDQSRQNPFVTKPFADESQPDHRVLYEAIVARDEDAAVAAVARILNFVETTLRDED